MNYTCFSCNERFLNSRNCKTTAGVIFITYMHVCLVKSFIIVFVLWCAIRNKDLDLASSCVIKGYLFILSTCQNNLLSLVRKPGLENTGFNIESKKKTSLSCARILWLLCVKKRFIILCVSLEREITCVKCVFACYVSDSGLLEYMCSISKQDLPWL